MELKNKLFQKGFSKEEIEDIVAFLEEEGYINDEKLAYRYKELSIEKGESPLKLKSKLYKKGVTVDFSYEEEFQSALNRLKKYTGSKDFKSIVKYFLNRGFSYSVASDVAKKCLNGEI